MERYFTNLFIIYVTVDLSLINLKNIKQNQKD